MVGPSPNAGNGQAMNANAANKSVSGETETLRKLHILGRISLAASILFSSLVSQIVKCTNGEIEADSPPPLTGLIAPLGLALTMRAFSHALALFRRRTIPFTPSPPSLPSSSPFHSLARTSRTLSAWRLAQSRTTSLLQIHSLRGMKVRSSVKKLCDGCKVRC